MHDYRDSHHRDGTSKLGDCQSNQGLDSELAVQRFLPQLRPSTSYEEVQVEFRNRERDSFIDSKSSILDGVCASDDSNCQQRRCLDPSSYGASVWDTEVTIP